MDSGGGGEKDGDGSGGDTNSSPGLHDHSDLLIPNPSFSSASSVIPMNIASPSSDHDLQKHMDCHMTSPHSVSSGDGHGHQQEINSMDFTNLQQSQPDPSPPNVVVDDSPLQPCMNRNKESLKVKLLMRRPMNQLVEQGILPPPKTPAAFAGQRVRLERARMGDLLKAKIQQRPARQELIRQHILEDTDSRVAPLLAEKQRMLKRARLADSLNDHLIHRPGPLELVQKNILHAPDADIEKAIKEGFVSFKATSEGHVPGPSLPSKYTCNEDDSSSDISSPAGTPDASSSGHTTEASTPISKQLSDPAIAPAPAPPAPSEPCEVTLQPAKTNKSETTQLILTTAPATPKLVAPPTIFQVAPVPPQQTTVTAVIPPPPPLPPSGTLNSPQTIVLSDGAVRELLPQLQSAGFQLATHVQNAACLVSPSPKSLQSSSSSLGKSRSSKKSSKSKNQPKTRTIKFHEYKGPMSCQQKGGSSSSSSSSALLGSSAASKAESSYELLLKQQQLFLQWQLEWQHKYPQILLPAAPKLPGGAKGIGNSTIATTLMSSYPVTTIPASLCTNLINNQISSQPIAVTTTINASQKPIAVTLAPKSSSDATTIQQTAVSTVASIIAPKPNSSESSQHPEQSKSDVQNVPSPSTSESSKGEKSIKLIHLNNISEWKVNDLKAELKRRSLPVSGSKMQLVERLKKAVAASQQNAELSGAKPVTAKMELADENSSEANMDVGNTDEGDSSKGKTSGGTPSPVIGTVADNNNVPVNNNISILDLANGKLNGVPISIGNILDLLGVSLNAPNDNNATNPLISNNPADANNLKNSGVTTAKVISQLPISAVVAKAAAAAANNPDPTKYVDGNKILEQQKQILELQKALRISQQQLQQLAQQKDPKNGGPQKHRLVLQQHIHQKLQQQAIQNQLQNLIQLQTQQAEQKKQQQLLQQQQQQQQQQPQLVLISSGGNNSQQIVTQAPPPPVSIANHVMTIANSPPNPVGLVNQSQGGAQPEHIKLENVHVNSPQQQDLSPNSSLNHHDSWLHLNAPDTSKSLIFDELVQSIGSKDIPKIEPAEEGKEGNHGVKSQMVDDVLEILIRNGELPPSAAQDPHAKNGSSSSSSTVGAPGSNDNRTNETTAAVPPPPPPLPPPTFSVMLPTTIPFSRHNHSGNEFMGSSTLGRADDKDAQEILRICEDLSNFGKSREAEAARLEAGNKQQEQQQQHTNFSMDGNNPSTMDCGFFTDSKDFDLSDSMDVGFDDTHSVSMHSTSSHTKSEPLSHDFHKHQFHSSTQQQQPSFGIMLNSADKNCMDGQFSFGNSHPHHQNATLSLKSHGDHSHHFLSDEELLPGSLDMQMDTDYADWLDNFLPVNNESNAAPPAAPTNHISAASQAPTSNLFHADVNACKNISVKRPQLAEDHHHNNNVSASTSNTNNLFSSLLDDHTHHSMNTHHQQQRDPLLSSRSFTRMPHPFGSDQLLLQNNFLLAHHPNNHNNPTLFFHTGSSPATTLMDTDFDELTPSLSKKSESTNTTELPSTTAPSTAITTNSVSINDNFLWDFAM